MRTTLVLCVALLLATCTGADDGEALYLDTPYGWRLKIAAEPIPRMPELPVAASQVRTIADALRLLADQGAETVRFFLETQDVYQWHRARIERQDAERLVWPDSVRLRVYAAGKWRTAARLFTQRSTTPRDAILFKLPGTYEWDEIENEVSTGIRYSLYFALVRSSGLGREGARIDSVALGTERR